MSVYRTLEEGGKKVDWRVSFRLFRYILPHRALLIAAETRYLVDQPFKNVSAVSRALQSLVHFRPPCYVSRTL